MKAIAITGIVVFSIVAVILPMILLKDADNLSVKDIDCAKRDTKMILENPIERILILKTIVEKKEGDLLFTNSYTFGGIKYATVQLVCDERATVTWRWFGEY